MKTAMLLFFTLLSSIFSLQAENWDLFPYNQKTYFHFVGERTSTASSQKFDVISPYYVDAVETIHDLQYQYILRAYIEEMSPDCYQDFASYNDTWFAYGLWLPNEVILSKNGWYGEATRNGSEIAEQTLTIHSLANVGDKWHIEGDYNGFTHIEISCLKKELEIVLGLEDSVKTFGIQAFQEDLMVNSPFDAIEFRISKKYGLVEGVLLKNLLQDQKFTKIELAGFEGESGDFYGQKSPTLLDFVPNFQVGDLLKWHHVYEYPMTPSHTTWFRDSITQVTQTASSLQYTYDRTTHKIIQDGTTSYNFEANLVQNYENDTHGKLIELAYYGYSVDERYDELILKRGNIDLSFNELSQTIAPQLKTQFQGVYFDSINCDFASLTNESQSTYYTPSLGIYLIDNSFWEGQNFFTELIGYQINGEIGGDIEAITTNIESPTYFAEQITLHPNPTQNRFRLQLQSPKIKNLQLTITDIHGRTLQQMPLLQSSIEVDLSEQTAGIYLVQISDGQNWWTEKVVKF